MIMLNCLAALVDIRCRRYVRSSIGRTGTADRCAPQKVVRYSAEARAVNANAPFHLRDYAIALVVAIEYS